ncbi:MAG: SUF system Fe-S cluster assembly protein [Planctomycetota bacterium]|nr:MAG: SUF system Fe-S cluster assembly protein [Planctomycetota bacterium]
MSETAETPQKTLHEQVVDVLRTVYDPEIPVNIHELGLIYNVDVTPEGAVAIRMTLTSPMCPVAGSLPVEVENKIKQVPGVTSVEVVLSWEPPWGPEMMSEAARLALGIN